MREGIQRAVGKVGKRRDTARGAAAGFPIGIDQAGRQRIHTVTKLILVVREGIQRAVGKVGKRRDIGDRVREYSAPWARSASVGILGIMLPGVPPSRPKIAPRSLMAPSAISIAMWPFSLTSRSLRLILIPFSSALSLPRTTSSLIVARRKLTSEPSAAGLPSASSPVSLIWAVAVSTHAGQVSSPCRWSP